MRTVKTAVGRARRRRGPRVALLLATMAGFVLMIAAAGAVIAPSTFQGNDGNMLESGGQTDWNTSALGAGKFQDASGSADDSITGGANGGKEDVEYPFLTTGSVPPKTDLTWIGIATEKVGGNDFLYASSIRKAPNGSANLNFELNKGTGTPAISPNGVTPTRVAGDRLITFDFTSGGTKAEITVLTWRTAAGGCYDPQAVNPCWGDAQDLDATGFAEGAANDGQSGRTGAITAGDNWLSGEALSANQFQEMSVNLTTSNILPAGRCETFAYVTTKSRSSGSSFLSSLKDINVANRPISNCGSINVRKTDDATPANNLAGATFKLYVSNLDAVFNSSDVASVDQDGNAHECTTTAAGTCSIGSVFFGEYWLDETVVPSGYSKPSNLPQKVNVTSTTTLSLTFVNPRARGSIVVQKNDASNNPLAGAAFAIDADGNAGTTDDQTSIPLVAGSTSRFCIDNLTFGAYTVVETQVPAGYTGDTPKQHTINSASACPDRTSGQDLTFVNRPAPGRINVLKTDDANAVLAGAAFTLYVDTNGNGVRDSGENTVQDGPLATDANGTLSFLNVPLGKYCVVETTTPSGYETAAAPQCMTVGLGSTAGQGQTISLTFVNPRLHNVVVIVCHQGSNTLHPSSVSVSGAAAQTSISAAQLTASGLSVTQAQLCQLAQANFGDLTHGSKSATINIAEH